MLYLTSLSALSINRSKITKSLKPQKMYIQPLLHHIFNGINESKSQPSMNLRLSFNKSDYEQFNLPSPEPTLNSSKLRIITDTGAQSSLMGIKAFRKHGFDESLIVPAKKRIYAANEKGIDILGAFFGQIGGQNKQGQFGKTPEMIHVMPGPTSSAVHTPAQIPIHWRDTIKEQLDVDVAHGVIEKVPPNTPTAWCHCAFGFGILMDHCAESLTSRPLINIANEILTTLSHLFNKDELFHRQPFVQSQMHGTGIILSQSTK